MKKLTKLIDKNALEVRWNKGELLLWIPFRLLGKFSEIVINKIMDGEGVNSHIQMGVVCVDLVPICDFYDFDPEEIKSKS